jgi:hypothetical protein
MHALLADVGRPAAPYALNLLNAGWAVTAARATASGTYGLPAQVLAVFIEAPWELLDRPHRFSLELVDRDGVVAKLRTRGGLVPARTAYDLVVPRIPGAPEGTPGTTCTMFEASNGFIEVPAVRRRYTWLVNFAGVAADIGFWVEGERPDHSQN